MVEVFRDSQFQHCVTEKLQPFVIRLVAFPFPLMGKRVWVNACKKSSLFWRDRPMAVRVRPDSTPITTCLFGPVVFLQSDGRIVAAKTQ